MADEYPIVTKEEFIKGVGNTPLVKIESLSKETGRDIYIKAEFKNSGKSIKDRAAIYLLNDALSKGTLKEGGTLVEATAGNTGVALALIARTYNPPFKVVLYIPETTVTEKINVLESLGCTVIKASIVPPDHPEFMNTLAIKYAETHENTIHINQMDSLVNRQAHYETTGPEIWKQTNGKINAFVASCGTGGTYTGIASYLKEVSNGKVLNYVSDREGSGLHSYVQSKGTSWEAEGSSFVEGVGKTAHTGNTEGILNYTDGSYRILDEEVLVTMYKLLDEDNLSVGASSALNITAAKKLALTLPKGSIVVTTAADSSERYASKAFNKEWLIENGHWDKIPQHLQKHANYNN
ncbi:Cystathionine beta-synthase [Wickerhamomyces ciferrii]|uniref:Cystathionine beta-synthase n=1 Tax=Wickerhamomyces ciferrii (strain ATCC 14091 / BCRC 22168 / CBS 111 / JCM 3599 / NBRC 0793 / NRRL Y-1031 F-60-10) TaxID=1206466 RepID=K0KXR1_WICCF|nr:Cystathionine beta-synthase [Wickerhamomyces ciferrii]CCH46827.1 Cystathionine beta-synthase [Wickerhamomyces ciferrii]